MLQTKALKQKALQQVQQVAGSPAASAAAWEEAVRQVQFEGGAKEGAQFKDWKDKDGEALKEREAMSAAQLHFRWMALTLQRSLGTLSKDLLPQVVAFTKDVAADQDAIDALDDAIRREKELTASGKHGKDRKGNDEAVKRVHDQILRSPVNASVAARALKISELMTADKWEMTPGNVDGIFNRIILPELRAQKDPRVLEYWDMKLKREAEAVGKSKLAFDADKFTNVRRPELLWSRALDLLAIGQRNRAIGEMFNLLKAHPMHPNAGDWLTTLEQTLTPPPPVSLGNSEDLPPALGAPPPLAPPPAVRRGAN